MQLPSRHSGVFQSLSYGLASVGGSLFSAFSLIILSRALGPNQFGAFSVAFSLTQVSARLADLGLSVALQQFIAKRYRSQPDSVAAAIGWASRIKLVAALLVIALGLMLGPAIGAHLFGLSEPSFASLGIALSSIIILYEYVVLVNQSVHQFKVAALLNALQALLKFSFGLFVLGIYVPSAYHSYLIYGILPAVSILWGYLSLPAKYKRMSLLDSGRKTALINTAKFSYIAAIAITLADQLDVLMVQSLLDEHQTGLYSAASRISLLFTLFAFSVGSVLNTRVAGYTASDIRIFLRKSLYAGGGILLLTPLLLLFAAPLLGLTAGIAYREALPAVRLLLVSSTLTMATIPFISIFYGLSFPRYFMYAGLLQIITLIAGNLVLIPLMGIEGSALAKIAMRAIVLVYTLFTAVVAVNQHHDHT